MEPTDSNIVNSFKNNLEWINGLETHG